MKHSLIYRFYIKIKFLSLFILFVKITMDEIKADNKVEELLYYGSKVFIGEVITNNTYGTGFLFNNNGIFITAKHLIEDVSSITVILNKEKVKIDTLYFFENNKLDLVIIKLEISSSEIEPIFKISNFVSILDPIFLISNPHGVKRTITKGFISNFIDLDGLLIFTGTASSSLGSSGGPVFNSNGHLIGVHTGTYGGANQHIIPIRNLIEGVSSVKPVSFANYFDNKSNFKKGIFENIFGLLTQFWSKF
jgi:S1-C subfamily serine protease